MANVTEARMEAYLRAFQDEYLSSVERYLPSQDRDRLVRYSLLPAAVTGYVLTQFGAGYEYGVGDDTISIRRSSKRIEELFAWLSRREPFVQIGSSSGAFLREPDRGLLVRS